MEELKRYMISMAEGNPGAVTAIGEIFGATGKDPWRTIILLGKLDKWGIKGPLLWLCYKDICDFDALKLIDMIEDGSMYAALESLPYGGYSQEDYDE